MTYSQSGAIETTESKSYTGVSEYIIDRIGVKYGKPDCQAAKNMAK